MTGHSLSLGAVYSYGRLLFTTIESHILPGRVETVTVCDCEASIMDSGKNVTW